MRFNKLIYIRYMPLTAKIYKDFYMKEAADAGIEVEYWDITALYFRHDVGQEDSSALTNTRKFKTFEELEQAIASEKQLNQTLFISIMTFEGRVGKLYRMFTKYNCNLGVFGRNMIPLAPRINLSLLDRLRTVTLPKLINYVLTKRIKKQKTQGKIKSYDVLFLGGTIGWKGIGHIDASEVNQATVVKLNSDDYDNFLVLKNAEPIIKGEYILFLDEYLPLHPDAALFGIKNVTPEQYYPELCSYFSRVESQFGIPVIIAAHPKALKYKEENYFDGRTVYFGKSAELSKFATFVLAHDSTSINYPIAFGKKLHFITSKNIEKGINVVHQNVLHYANYLGCNYQWFDEDDEINLVGQLPEDNYRKYKYDYQTWPETEEKFSNEIFIDFFKN